VKKILILVLCLFVFQAAAFAVTSDEKPTVLPQGAIEIEANVAYWMYGAIIDSAGTQVTMPAGYSFSETRIPLAVNYGLLDNIEVGMSIPYRSLSYTPWTGFTAITASGFGDLVLSGKMNLNPETAVGLDLKSVSGQSSGGSNAIENWLGTGNLAVTLRGICQRALMNGIWYATLGYTLGLDDANQNNDGSALIVNVAADYALGNDLNCTGGLYTSLGSDAKTNGTPTSGPSSSAILIGLEKQVSPALLARVNFLMGIWGKTTFATTRIQAGIEYGL